MNDPLNCQKGSLSDLQYLISRYYHFKDAYFSIRIKGKKKEFLERRYLEKTPPALIEIIMKYGPQGEQMQIPSYNLEQASKELNNMDIELKELS